MSAKNTHLSPEQSTLMHHEFSFYSDQASLIFALSEKQDLITITDGQLWHRLKHVVRAQPNMHLILFDKKEVVRVTLCALDAKNRLQFKFQHSIQKVVLTPRITIMLPLLKKEALTEAFYTATELGANHIQLVTTEKSQHAWSETRDKERYEKVMIAAAEQSKQFMLPTISDPLPLQDALKKCSSPQTLHIHCDPHGAPLFNVLQKLKDLSCTHICISIGPEGDLTSTEREFLYQHTVIACALTPTVVRSTQALVIALGAVRSTVF